MRCGWHYELVHRWRYVTTYKRRSYRILEADERLVFTVGGRCRKRREDCTITIASRRSLTLNHHIQKATNLAEKKPRDPETY